MAEPSPRDEPHLDSDPEADGVYAAELAAAEAHPVRRFARFAELATYVESVTTSEWWDETFPSAPVEVELQRRSHRAGASLAATTAGRVGVIALVDGHGWGLDTVLHELAHLAAGPGAGHGPGFHRALVELWRHEVGIGAATILAAALSGGTRADELPGGSPRQGRHL